jgi:hypothetical protein
MKIEFGLTQDFLFKSGYNLKDQTKMPPHEKYAFVFKSLNRTEPIEDTIICLRKIINDNFKSIVWKKISWGWTFDFRDEADEAAFLLWSSDGIEI